MVGTNSEVKQIICLDSVLWVWHGLHPLRVYLPGVRYPGVQPGEGVPRLLLLLPPGNPGAGVQPGVPLQGSMVRQGARKPAKGKKNGFRTKIRI